jgi:hypothetical protein
MADSKKEKLSLEEVEALKKVEASVKPDIKDEDKIEITNLKREIQKVEESREKEDKKDANVEGSGGEKEETINSKEEDKKVEKNEEKEDKKDVNVEGSGGKKEKSIDSQRGDKKVEEKPSDSTDSTEEGSSYEESVPKGAKNKNLMAQNKVEEIRSDIDRIEKEVKEVIDDLQNRIAQFESYEANVLNGAIARAKEKLKEIGFERQEDEDKKISIKAEIKNDDKPISINDISTGFGEAFVTGLLGGASTMIGWCIYVSRELGTPFPPRHLPDVAEITTKVSAISSSLGMGKSAGVGVAVVAGSSLIVFSIIYKIVASMRASKNLEITRKLEKDAREYSKKKLEFKEMLMKIGEHIDSLKDTTEKFEVLLDEKSASLRRAKIFEGNLEFDKLNVKTRECAEDTYSLIVGLERLLTAPMAKDAVLNDESVKALDSAKELISIQTKKIYG